MGLDADVLAIGKFQSEIVNFLDYPPEHYRDTLEGMPIICTVFQAVTTNMSYELAAYFNIRPWDFNRHELDPYSADLDKLIESDFAEDVPKFLKLREVGFKFYYRPNG